MSRLEKLRNLIRESQARESFYKAEQLRVSLLPKISRPPINDNLRDYTYRPGVYGFSGVQPAREAARIAENARIDRAVYEGIQRGIRPNIARSKLVNLIKKVRKKTGKTYYQRMQVAKLQEVASSKPLTAKKYIKGVDFSYAIYP
jgi:hypothetical protein